MGNAGELLRCGADEEDVIDLEPPSPHGWPGMPTAIADELEADNGSMTIGHYAVICEGNRSCDKQFHAF